MKKTVACLLAGLIILSVTGCTPQGGSSSSTGSSSVGGSSTGSLSGSSAELGKEQQDILYTKGLELMGLVGEMASNPAYSQMMTSSPEIGEALKAVAAVDFAAPQNVYQIIPGKQVLELYLSQISESDVPTLSPALRKMLTDRISQSVPSLFNGMQGSTNLAASSIVMANDAFVVQGLQQPMLYLYTYGGNYCGMVTFIPGSDGAVSASATYVQLTDGLLTEDSIKGVEEMLISSVIYMGAQVFQLEKPQ